MKKPKISTFVLSSLIIVSITSNALGETFTLTEQEKRQGGAIKACNEALNACDEALNKADQVIKDKNGIITIRDKQVQELSAENGELKSQRDSLLRSPLLWFFVGIAVGGITYAAVQKAH